MYLSDIDPQLVKKGMIEVEETVVDQLVLHELDENYEPSLDGVICEDILEKLARMG